MLLLVKQLVKTRSQAAAPRVSKIRRDPVRIGPAPAAEAKPYSPEREIWRTVAGVTAFGLAAVALAVGIGAITRQVAAAPRPAPPPFRQCYEGGGPTCVLDGDTIFINRERLDIAGMDAPEVRGATCPQERTRGIAAALRLAELLNDGKVVVGAPERAADGQLLRKVMVDGRDVSAVMVGGGFARKYGHGLKWC